MTNGLLAGICLGQVFIILMLCCVHSKNVDMLKQLGKIQLAVQELCDRIWDLRKD